MAGFENIATLDSLDDEYIKDRSVLLRTSFDIFDEHGNMKDTFRIETAESTIRLLKQIGAKRIIIMTYAGRPEKTSDKKGKNARYNGVLYDSRYSMLPVADFMSKMLGEKVHFVSAVDEQGNFFAEASDYIKHAASYIEKNVNSGVVVLLDNLRFWEGENNGDKEIGKEFARLIASLGNVYVQEGFAQAHRTNNATVGEITKHTRINVIGLHFKKEIQYLKGVFDNLIEQDRKPFVFIIGGKKVETKPGIVSKIEVVSKLMDNMRPSDKIFIGGAIAYPYIIARGYLDHVKKGAVKISENEIKNIVGDSFIDWDQIQEQINIAGKMLLKAEKKGIKVKLPIDHGVLNGNNVQYVNKISEGMAACDIGPKTVREWGSDIKHSHTIILTGPVGWYENEKFSAGSKNILKAIAFETEANGTISIAAGGDTTEMVRSFGYTDNLSLVSIGGGATLEFLHYGGFPVLELMTKKNQLRTF